MRRNRCTTSRPGLPEKMFVRKVSLCGSVACTATILRHLAQLLLLLELATKAHAALVCYNGTGDQTTEIIPCVLDLPVSVCCNVTDICVYNPNVCIVLC